jgi:cytochrome c
MKIRLFAATLMILPSLTGTAIAASDDGETLFRQRCQMCHSLDPAKPVAMGPTLRSVVGRRAATARFAYSEPLVKSRLVWTRANLARFLAAPTALVPGTKMPIAVPDAAQRAAIIGYLARRR